MGISIRKMMPEDVEEVYRNERLSFKSEAWQKEDFSELACEPDGSVLMALVAESGGKLCGYVCVSCIAGEMEINSVLVFEGSRRQGIGKRLISEAVSICSPLDIFLEVRKSNTAARRLYESMGFKTYGVRKGYYSSPPEDAVLYRCGIGEFVGTAQGRA